MCYSKHLLNERACTPHRAMSIRQRQNISPTANAGDFDPATLRNELESMRQTMRQEHKEMEAGISATGYNGNAPQDGLFTDAMRDFDRLTPTEKQAASLGVNPDSFRPLKELNEAHFKALRKANALSPQLEANIKAFAVVAGDPIE